MSRSSPCLLCQAALARQEGRYDEALSLLEEVLRGLPSHREARLLRAQVYALTGRAERALEALRGLIADEPGDIEAHLNLAGVYLLLGLYGEATTHLKLASIYGRREGATRDEPPFSRN